MRYQTLWQRRQIIQLWSLLQRVHETIPKLGRSIRALISLPIQAVDIHLGDVFVEIPDAKTAKLVTTRQIDHLQLGRGQNLNLRRAFRASQLEARAIGQQHVVGTVRKPHLVRLKALQFGTARETKRKVGPIVNCQLLQLR